MFNIIKEITECYRLKSDAKNHLVKLQREGKIKEKEKWIVRKVLEQEIITFCYGDGQISFDVDDIEWDI